MVVIGKSVFFQAKMVLFGKKCCFWAKLLCSEKSGSNRTKAAVFEQKLLCSGKVVLIRHKWLYLDKDVVF